MPLESLIPSASPSIVPRSKSLLSKFTNPLANRNKHISDFHIEPDDPWKSYAPGDTVTGCVALTVVKPVRITHILVCLHGYAKVFKNQVAPGEGYAEVGQLGVGRGQRGEEYLGNALMSLFDDEVVLCGEGRLKEGVYRFKFELEFPSKRLPSSIDFERGVVCYKITGSLTRPTTIAPIVTCERRISFQDVIDIAPLPPMKPKSISLEPVSKRGRVKTKLKPGSLEQALQTRPPALSRANTETNESTHSSQEPADPQSPAASETSRASIATESSQSFRLVQQPSVMGSSLQSSDLRSSSSSVSEQAIKASIELLRPGVLPGDIIPLKISIKHTKPSRGIVVVTLFRSGRLDLHPAVPMGPQSKGEQPEYEDVFPKSRTGLGGLHFASGSPSSNFRKDLSQSTALMIVNPQTLEAEVKASLKVPDDAFPTMDNVPGAMIEFRYHVEVVVDLCGKLSESSFLSRLSIINTPNNFVPSESYDQVNHLTSSMNERILDTSQMRRIKMVASCHFDIIVGSRDSSRTTRKWADGDRLQGTQADEYSEAHANNEYAYEWTEEDYRRYYGDQYPQDGYWQDGSNLETHPAETLVPPPEPEEAVDEKTRLRRMEELLLPSQPPQVDDAVASSAAAGADNAASAPSAPYLPEDDDLCDHQGSHDQRNVFDNGQSLVSTISAHSVETIVRAVGEDLPQFQADRVQQIRDDKQEMERRRLLELASAPPTSEDGNRHQSPPATDPTHQAAAVPTAPMLTEEDEYPSVASGDPRNEALPRYSR